MTHILSRRTRLAMSACTAALVATAAWSQPAAAQNGIDASAAESAPSGEIIVTARKRSESLQDTPLSIQALTAEQLERSDIADLDDVAAYSPGVTLFENVDRGYGQVFVRGMQSTPPVGDTTRELASVFIDGIYYTGGVSGINTDNVERVEVIKGPQSALYGRSTFSGAINFITKNPGDTFTGKVHGKIAQYNDYEVGASFDAPILPGVLATRISGQYRTFGGQYSNQLNNQRLGEEEDWNVSGQILATPSPGLSAKLTAMYFVQSDGPAASVLTGKKPIHNVTTPSGSTFYDGVLKWDGVVEQNVFPSDPKDIFGFNGARIPFTDFERLGRSTNGLDRDFLFTSWDLEYKSDAGYSINYLGGYSRDHASRLYDFELSRENNYFGSRRTDSRANSHELRFASPADDRLSWLVGGFYMEQDLYERDPGGIFGPGVFGFAGITGNQVVIAGTASRTTVDLHIVNKAAFGSLDFDITDVFKVSLEGRYQIDELTAPIVPTQTTKSFLPRAILQYDISPDVMLYAVAAKGVRPTVINTQFIQRPTSEQEKLRAAYPELVIAPTAPPETIWSYELGAKTTLLDGRMTFNINGYYADWKDRQNLQSLLFNFGSGIQPTLVTVNGSDVEAYGIEVESSVAVTPALTLSGNFAWNHTALVGPGKDAIIARFLLDPTPDGQRLPQVPEISGSLILDYRLPDGFFFRAEGIYVGSRYADSLELAETGASLDVNLRAGADLDHFNVSLFVENLFNDMTFESLRSNADCATTAACSLRAYEAILPRKRQVGVTFGYKF